VTEKKTTPEFEGSKEAELVFAVSDLHRALSKALETAGADSEFQAAARHVVGAVGSGLLTGYPGHVIALSKRLSYKRLKAEWARMCAWHRGYYTDDQIDDQVRERLVSNLCDALHRLAGTEKALTPEHIAKALRTTDTPTGFAARLACDVQAFGYTDQEKAYRAFAKFKGER